MPVRDPSLEDELEHYFISRLGHLPSDMCRMLARDMLVLRGPEHVLQRFAAYQMYSPRTYSIDGNLTDAKS